MQSTVLTVILSVIVTVAGITLAAWAGGKLGARAAGRSALYWLLNLAAVAVGFALSFLAAAVSFPYLSLFSIGFIAGAITGLKYGYGRSEGIWRTHDVWMKNDKDLVKPHEDAEPADSMKEEMQ